MRVHGSDRPAGGVAAVGIIAAPASRETEGGPLLRLDSREALCVPIHTAGIALVAAPIDLGVVRRVGFPDESLD